MRKVVKLRNVIDTRTGRFHSIAIIYKDLEKYFEPAPEGYQEKIEDYIYGVDEAPVTEEVAETEETEEETEEEEEPVVDVDIVEELLSEDEEEKEADEEWPDEDVDDE